MRIIPEHPLREKDLAISLGVHVVRAVNHYLSDCSVIQQRLNGPVAFDFVEYVCYYLFPHANRKGEALCRQNSTRDSVYLAAQAVPIELPQLRRIHVVHELLMDPAFQKHEPVCTRLAVIRMFA